MKYKKNPLKISGFLKWYLISKTPKSLKINDITSFLL